MFSFFYFGFFGFLYYVMGSSLNYRMESMVSRYINTGESAVAPILISLCVLIYFCMLLFSLDMLSPLLWAFYYSLKYVYVFFVFLFVSGLFVNVFLICLSASLFIYFGLYCCFVLEFFVSFVGDSFVSFVDDSFVSFVDASFDSFGLSMFDLSMSVLLFTLFESFCFLSSEMFMSDSGIETVIYMFYMFWFSFGMLFASVIVWELCFWFYYCILVCLFGFVSLIVFYWHFVDFVWFGLCSFVYLDVLSLVWHNDWVS